MIKVMWRNRKEKKSIGVVWLCAYIWLRVLFPWRIFNKKMGIFILIISLVSVDRSIFYSLFYFKGKILVF